MTESTFEEQSVNEAHDRLGDYTVIDVRFEHELDGPLGAIAGAEHIDRRELADRVEALKDDSLLVVCRSGRRSAAACAALAELGHGDVTNLAGGMIAWNDAGLPVEREPSHDFSDLADRVSHWFSMMVQKPVDEAAELLGLDAKQAPGRDAVQRALDAAIAHLEATAPPDLNRSVEVFRADLQDIAEAMEPGEVLRKADA